MKLLGCLAAVVVAVVAGFLASIVWLVWDERSNSEALFDYRDTEVGAW